MKCHYEVLNLPQDATDSDIKRAYRTLAFQWHPDKNLDNTEYAKEQFQIIQQAHEILSDPQERAWYDRHREEILRGADSEYVDNCLNVFQYFTTSCFKGYEDDDNGFYTVYRNVFETLANEEIEFIDKEEFKKIPNFGTSKSNYDEVVRPFYNYWMCFSTKKSYSWLYPTNIKEARGYRKAVKEIEKQNNKVKQMARKERNEEIANLVKFVRKRDKRVNSHINQMKEETLLKRQKQELLRKQKRFEMKRLNESTVQPEWTKFDNVEAELKDIEKQMAAEFGEDISESENEDLEESDLYCWACNKLFKTEKTFKNHESSKKHKENVEIMKEVMVEEEANFQSNNESDRNEDSDNSANLSDTIEIEETKTKSKKKNKKSKKIVQLQSEDEDNHFDHNIVLNDSDNSEQFDFTSSSKLKKKNKNKKNENKKVLSPVNGTEVESGAKENGVKLKDDKRNKKENVKNDIDTDICCATCKSVFQSKNKLFDHLKKTNHGVLLQSRTKRK